MSRKFLSIAIPLIIVVMSIVATAGIRQKPDVTGTWKLTVVMRERTTNPDVTFNQEGETLTGTYKGRFGESPLKGTVKGNVIKFGFKVNAQGNEIQIDYDGTIEGNVIKGKVVIGDLGEGAFSGKRE